MSYLAFFCFSLFVLVPARAENPAKPVAFEEEQIVESVKCSLGEDQRKLEVQTRKAGCVLLYTKAGKIDQIASYKRGVEACQNTLKKVRANLERSGCAFKPAE